MFDKKQGNAAMNTKSSDKDVPAKSLIEVSTSILTPRILFEHNFTADPPKRTHRQLIVSIHARTSPKESQKQLPGAELTRLILNGNQLQRRMRRLVLSVRRSIYLKPMMPLQEAIAQELAKQFGCQTRFYRGPNESRYMVVYKPGVEPNSFEVQARPKDKGQEIYVRKEEIEGIRMEPMFFREGMLHWHQPMEWGDRQKAAEPLQNSLSLGQPWPPSGIKDGS